MTTATWHLPSLLSLALKAGDLDTLFSVPDLEVPGVGTILEFVGPLPSAEVASLGGELEVNNLGGGKVVLDGRCGRLSCVDKTNAVSSKTKGENSQRMRMVARLQRAGNETHKLSMAAAKVLPSGLYWKTRVVPWTWSKPLTEV